MSNVIRIIGITLIGMWSWGASALAIEYFDITNPRFEPLQVAVSLNPSNNVDLLFLQSVFQANLEQTLYFKVKPIDSVNGAKPSPDPKKYAFHLHLNSVLRKPLQIAYELEHLESKDRVKVVYSTC